ncbi:MAG TPA: ABC transporter substrate binding protein [Clostridia bacterium]|nr:ABC transporter substrate binding protein [Clostridia bacterium]
MPAKQGHLTAFSAIMLALMLILASATDVSAEDSSAPSELSQPKSILILNSYDESQPWTRDQNTGINEILNKDENGYSVYIEYMDWKEFPDQRNLEQIRNRLSYKYSDKKINVIITTDDAALKFALKYRDDMFSDAPVVFSGVDDQNLQGILEGKDNVTGVVEIRDPAGTMAAAKKINPDIKTVYVVFDRSESGLSSGEMTMNAIHKAYKGIVTVPLNDEDIDSLFEKVQKAVSNSVVFCSSYTPKAGNMKLGPDYFYRRLSSVSPVPVYNLYDFTLGTGIIGGSMISGRQNGEEVAKLAIRILNGENIGNLPIERKNFVHYEFDYKVLQRFHIELGSIPEGSLIINKPFNYFEEHRGLIYTSIIITLILLCFIMILLFYLRKVNTMKEVLSDSNSELMNLYKDLSEADNKLKIQYDELVLTQKSLTKSEDRYELLFDKMLNGFFIFEPIFNGRGRMTDIRFLKVNPGFFHQTNLPQTDVNGKTWSEIFGYPNQELSIFQNLLETGKTEPFESYNSKSGIYNLVEAFLISENQIGVVFENITGYKKAIKEVRMLNTGLEKRVQERTSELQDAVRELESFSYTVSHDLKSPLRAVDGYINILMEDLGERLDEDSLQILKNISTISKESIEMINKILQYSRTTRAELNREEVDMEKTVTDVYNELRLTCPDRNVSLVIDSGLPGVSADRVMIKLLLQNILSNAFKFTRDTAKAVITVGCTITSEEYAFYVKDNGIGFDMKYSGKLFSAFQRLHTAEEFEGSGVGLVTVKKIIEKHGGRVWIDSKLNQGTAIYFTLPFAG